MVLQTAPAGRYTFPTMARKSTLPAAPLKRAPRSRAALFPRKIDPDAQLDLFEREALVALGLSHRYGLIRSPSYPASEDRVDGHGDATK